MTQPAEEADDHILEYDQQAGKRVQERLLPVSGLQLGNLTFEYRIFPSIILSGDSVEYVELKDGRVFFYMADVSGHGAAGALVSALLKGITSGLLPEIEQHKLQYPAEVLEAINQSLRNFDIEQHVTMFLGLLDTKNKLLHFSNAAHFPATIFITGQTLNYLEQGSLPLGMYKSPGYISKSLELTDEYTIVMFSDGVLEIMDQLTINDKEERLKMLVKSGIRDVDSLAKELRIEGALNARDDIALFTITSKGR